MGIHPERFEVVVADPMDKAGKAEEGQAVRRACPRPPGRWLRHVRKSTFTNLGDPRARPQEEEVDGGAAQAAPWERGEVRPRHSSGEAGNDRGAKGVAERGSGEWEIGTELSVGQPFRTQCRRGANPVSKQAAMAALRVDPWIGRVRWRSFLDARL